MYEHGIDIITPGYFLVNSKKIYPNREAFEKKGFKFFEDKKNAKFLKFMLPNDCVVVGVSSTSPANIVCNKKCIATYDFSTRKLKLK